MLPAKTCRLAFSGSSHELLDGARVTVSFWVLLSLLGTFGLPAFAQSSPQNQTATNENKPTILQPGDSIERDLGGGQHHSYQLELPARQFLQIVVDQQGIDVVLKISQLDGVKLVEVDRPNGSRGRETISIVTTSAPSYTLEVRSLENVTAQGRYQLRVNPLRDQRSEDTAWIMAEAVVSKAEKLRAQSTAVAFRQAIAEFNRAADLWEILSQPYERALALYGGGMSSSALGENQKAIEYLSQALSLFEDNVHGRAITRAALGWPYMYLGENAKAEENFAAALQLYHEEGNLRGEGVALYGIGWVEVFRGRNREALKSFSESLARRQVAKDRRGEALTLTGLGKLEGRLGNHSKAVESLNKALGMMAGRDGYVEADILSNLGWLHSQLKHEGLALDYFNRALSLRRKVGDRIGEATTLYGISETQRRLGNLPESLEAIESALALIESVRAFGANQQLRISYFASVQDYYDYYIELLMNADRLDPAAGYAARALHACERARARGLIDVLPEAKIDLRDGIDPWLLELEQRNGEELNEAAIRRTELLRTPQTPEVDQRLAAEIVELTSSHEVIKARIRNANPRYAALTRPQPLTAIELQQQLLDKDTLLLEYWLGEDRSYLWAVTQDRFSSYELPPREEVEGIARRVYDELLARNRVVNGETSEAMRRRLEAADARANEAMRELSRILLSPVSERLTVKNLVIVAQGALQFIPFAALPSPSNGLRVKGQARLKKLTLKAADRSHALIADHQIVMLPSATTLAVLRAEAKNRAAPMKAVMVFADPVYSAADDRLPVAGTNMAAYARDIDRPLRSLDSNARVKREFPRLISSMWEGKRILDLVPIGQGKLLSDFAANSTTAMSAEIGNYRFLHFAAHALVDNEHPELSGVVLSMVDENGRPQDGFLRSNEIFNLKLSAELVVLSACRTGLGKHFNGEGLIGLTRGFMYAGAPRVVTSLWDIQDKPTAELMIRFYGHMLGPEKLTAAAALRRAQLELSKDSRWQSPYFWAGFVLQGEWR